MYLNIKQFFTKGKKLPYDAELEYLESTSAGGQYIDTGIPFDDNSIEVDFTGSFTKPVSDSEGYFGSVGNKIFIGTYITMYGNSSSDYTIFRFSNAYTSETSSPALIYQGGFCRVLMSKSKVQIWDSEGTLVKDADESGTTSASLNGLNIYLYAWNVNGTTVESYAKNAKFKSFKITKNGVVLRDMIPVRVGTEGMMYDKVTGTLFHNLGTGDFICGRDKGTLPYDSEIEYLETTSEGGQYIDTGVIAESMNYRFESVIVPVSNTLAVLFGTMNTDNGYPGIMINDGGSFRYGTQQTQSISPSFVSGTTYNLVLSFKQLSVNGVIYTARGTTLTTPLNYPIYIFARNNVGTAGNHSIAKVLSFKIYNNSTLIRDFIPVRVGSEGCLYDRVTETIFHNAGTGDFILGPDV